MKIAKHAVQITIEVVNRSEVGLSEDKLYISIVKQIFCPLAVILSQLQRPGAQSGISVEEYFLVRIEIASNSRRLYHGSIFLRRRMGIKTHARSGTKLEVISGQVEAHDSGSHSCAFLY